MFSCLSNLCFINFRFDPLFMCLCLLLSIKCHRLFLICSLVFICLLMLSSFVNISGLLYFFIHLIHYSLYFITFSFFYLPFFILLSEFKFINIRNYVTKKFKNKILLHLNKYFYKWYKSKLINDTNQNLLY